MPLEAGSNGTCPHCKRSVRFEEIQLGLSRGSIASQSFVSVTTPGGTFLSLALSGCPACTNPIVVLSHFGPAHAPGVIRAVLWPDVARPVPAEVEAKAPGLAADFREAVAVLPKSRKASAALSRRCLQYVLAHEGGANSRDLSTQIDEVLPSLPPHISQSIDAVRQVGNFAAHPLKSKTSGEILDVEPGEAEWLLDVLEDLFGHYYVAPAQAAARRGALNEKLKAAGKPPLKGA